MDETPPFYFDLLQDRKALASRLTEYVDRLKNGAVMAIDAQWGDGKTWFGKNWKQQLEQDNRKAIYIDAFEQDYIKDPFVLIASEFMGLLENNTEKKEYKDKAIKVAKATMSISAKVGIGLATKYLLGGVNLGEEIEASMQDATDEVGSVSSKWIEAKFDEYENDKKTIVAFKKELEKLASQQNSPIVIFIDELDRCKPDFAVRLIERIKHFFDVPNIVFILFINREQLENAIKGVYGSDTNASAYLGKFINFFFLLPKPKIEEYQSEVKLTKFIKATFDAYKFPTIINDYTIEFFAQLVLTFDLSLRDIEAAIGLFAFAYDMKIKDGYIAGDYLLYVIVLKQKDYKSFKKLVEGDIETHKLIRDKIYKALRNNRNDYTFQMLGEWHTAYINNFENIGEKINNVYNTWKNTARYHDCVFKDMLPWFAKKIDLKLEK